MPVEQWKSSRASLYQGKILIFHNMSRKTSHSSYTRLVKSCRGNICHTHFLQHISRMNYLQRGRYRLPLPAKRPRLWMSRWSWPQTGPGSGTRQRARIPLNPDESARVTVVAQWDAPVPYITETGSRPAGGCLEAGAHQCACVTMHERHNTVVITSTALMLVSSVCYLAYQ